MFSGKIDEFEIKEAATGGILVFCNVIKKRLQHRCFPVNIGNLLTGYEQVTCYIKSSIKIYQLAFYKQKTDSC